MKRNRVVAALLVAAVLVPLSAYPAKKGPPKPVEAAPAKWAQEPDGFLGIKFGEPLPDSISECPKYMGSVDFRVVNQLSHMCFDGTRSSYGNLWGTVDLGFPYSVAVMMNNGVPVSFVIDTTPEHFGALAKVLVQRYGNPTRTTDGTVQSKAGAEFDNQTLSWLGSKVSIEASMRQGQVDKSQTYISDKVYWDRKTAEDSQKSLDGASKL